MIVQGTVVSWSGYMNSGQVSTNGVIVNVSVPQPKSINVVALLNPAFGSTEGQATQPKVGQVVNYDDQTLLVTGIVGA